MDRPDGPQEPVIFRASDASWAIAEAIERPPAALSRIAIFASVVILAASAIGSLMLSVPTYIPARGTIRMAAETRAVRSPAAARLLRILVAEDQAVAAGQPLVELEGTLVRAPASGIVYGFAGLAVEDMVAAGAPLLRLRPADGPMIALLEVRNRDIGEVREGMAVRLRIDALPADRYGLLEGVVAIAPRLASEGSEDRPGRERPYILKVTLNAPDNAAMRRDHKVLREGMMVSGSLLVRRRSMLSFIVHDILRIGDSFQ